MEEVLSGVNVKLIQARKLKVVFEAQSEQEATVMLPIFERLSCQVMSVMRPQKDMGKLVVGNEADLGVRLSRGGQIVTLYTESGKEVTDTQLLILQMLMAVKEGDPVGLPVTAPSVIEEMSEFVGIPLVRTKTVLRSLLEVGSHSPIQLHFDGFYSVVAVMHILCQEELTLEQVIGHFPMFHMHTQVVGCPVEAKGRVMRQLPEDVASRRAPLDHGVKVFHGRGGGGESPQARPRGVAGSTAGAGAN